MVRIKVRFAMIYLEKADREMALRNANCEPDVRLAYVKARIVNIMVQRGRAVTRPFTGNPTYVIYRSER